MLTNEDSIMIENIVSMLNKSPWNQDNQYDIKQIKEQCETEDVYDVIEKIREIDVQIQQEYRKNNQ